MNLHSCENKYSVMTRTVKFYQILLEEQSMDSFAIAASQFLEIKADIEWEYKRK